MRFDEKLHVADYIKSGRLMNNLIAFFFEKHKNAYKCNNIDFQMKGIVLIYVSV